MVCPLIRKCVLRKFERIGRLSLKWEKDYCECVFWTCKRYHKLSMSVPVPNNMLPDGTIDKKLKL